MNELDFAADLITLRKAAAMLRHRKGPEVDEYLLQIAEIEAGLRAMIYEILYERRN